MTRYYYAALDRDCETIEAVYSSQQQPRPAEGIPEDLRDVASRLGRRFVALDVSDTEAADLVLDLDRGLTSPRVTVSENGVARVCYRKG